MSLIDRDAIMFAILHSDAEPPSSRDAYAAADDVIAYLRSVITPEALAPETTHDGWREVDMPEGQRLYRAIFGDTDE